MHNIASIKHRWCLGLNVKGNDWQSHQLYSLGAPTVPSHPKTSRTGRAPSYWKIPTPDTRLAYLLISCRGYSNSSSNLLTCVENSV